MSNRRIIDLHVACIGIAVIELATWLSNTVPSNLTTGVTIGLALYIVIRLWTLLPKKG